jgi:DNA-directed RNA polymerase specialized sigma24 family protein
MQGHLQGQRRDDHVLYLQCVEEYKLTEISRLLGIEAETVKKRVQRGRKKLLGQLTKEHENDDT